MFWMLVCALAETPFGPVPPPEPVPEEEEDLPIIDVVYSVEDAVGSLELSLESMGYEPARVTAHERIYRHPHFWKPTLHLRDDGEFWFEHAPGIGKAVTNCIDIQEDGIPDACSTSGQMASPRLLELTRMRTFEALTPKLMVWRRSSDAVRLEQVQVQILPARVRRLWTRSGGGEAGMTALYNHFCTRLDNEWGQAVRSLVVSIAGEQRDVLGDVDPRDWRTPCEVGSTWSSP